MVCRGSAFASAQGAEGVEGEGCGLLRYSGRAIGVRLACFEARLNVVVEDLTTASCMYLHAKAHSLASKGRFASPPRPNCLLWIPLSLQCQFPRFES